MPSPNPRFEVAVALRNALRRQFALGDQRRMAVILLVQPDDHRESDLAGVLRARGHDVIACADRWEAIRLSATAGIDVALVDFSDPDTYGIEVILQLRKSVPGAIIVALSPDAHEANYGLLRLAASAGATMVVHRPASSEDVLRVVETCLQDRSRGP